VRARGQALGSSRHCLANAIIAAFFPVVALWRPGAPFRGSAAMMMMIVQFVVVALFPETTGARLETIAAIWRSKST
jgi:hypothetical protein